ncbi:hypothetical protein ACP70R_024550 [Stipagrostis hirtigluma subsp. patula]
MYIFARTESAPPRPPTPAPRLSQAMAAHDPLPYCVELDSKVDLVSSVEKEQEWGVIRCRSRTAYGCGEHGQMVVEGLTLLVQLAGYRNLTSTLCIRVDDQALRSIQAELGMSSDERLLRIGGGEMYGQGVIHSVRERVIVLTLIFHLLHCGKRFYYLVYDTVGESLSMVPHLPPCSASPLTATPVPMRRGEHVDLVLVGNVLQHEPAGGGSLVGDDVLWVWSSARSGGSSISPWQMTKRLVPPQVKQTFVADVAFCFQGQAFWADLSQGVMHCDPSTAGRRSAVEFDFIPLPPECQLVVEVTLDMEPMAMYRTMGRVGHSIKFVSIDRSGDPGGRMITLWTLHLDSQQWTRDEEFSVSSLWELEDFKSEGLPKTVPKCPVVMADGVVCFLLPNKRKRRGSLDDYICGIHMHNKTILWSGRLNMYRTYGPILLTRGFMKIDGL